ncbi:MAG: hypothetical protein Kow0042_06330 [Calditrichia bacterium]
MTENKKDRKITVENAGLVGPIWYMGWLFTLGFAKLTFWKAVLALIIWPYYLGSAIQAVG